MIAEGVSGPIGKKIQKAFFDVIQGHETQYSDWPDDYEVPILRKRGPRRSGCGSVFRVENQ